MKDPRYEGTYRSRQQGQAVGVNKPTAGTTVNPTGQGSAYRLRLDPAKLRRKSGN